MRHSTVYMYSVHTLFWLVFEGLNRYFFLGQVSNRLRSDDEVSGMSDKEKAALEVLQEMKTTPERRISSNNRFVYYVIISSETKLIIVG